MKRLKHLRLFENWDISPENLDITPHPSWRDKFSELALDFIRLKKSLMIIFVYKNDGASGEDVIRNYYIPIQIQGDFDYQIIGKMENVVPGIFKTYFDSPGGIKISRIKAQKLERILKKYSEDSYLDNIPKEEEYEEIEFIVP